MDVTRERVRQIMSKQGLTMRQITGLMVMLEDKNLNQIEEDLLEAGATVLANVVLQVNRRLNIEVAEIIEFEIGEPCEVQKPATSIQPEHWQRATIIGKRNTPGGHQYATSQTGRDLWIGTKRLKKVS